MALRDLVVLLVDCQTTGANPKSGSVIEIGWARSDALHDGEKTAGINAHLFKQPSDFEIPRRVQKLTGIEPDDLLEGSNPEDVWAQILSTAEAVAGLNERQTCPTVIHFAKFEIPFLTDLHVRFGANKDFPFTFICTHEMSRRLFPDLPRRSIRAIAGYLGHSLQELRRCREHVQATALIWREIVSIIEKKRGIHSLEQLLQWIHGSKSSISSSRVYPMSARKLHSIPHKPGVYRMLRSNGDVLYVGKASSIRQRVRSYFRKKVRHPEHILEMLSQARQLDLTVTESALEAAILETDEIKRFSPPYNVALRKGERNVWFCSNDFDEFSPAPTAEHRIGPIVDRETMVGFAAVRKVVEIGGVSEAAGELLLRGLGVPETYAPELQVVKAGYEIFLTKHRDILHAGAASQSLGELARQLWLQRKTEKLEEKDETEDFALKSIEIRAWTANSVCRSIESNIMRAGHAMRRARWLVLLTESSLGWMELPFPDGNCFVVVFENGQILYRRVQSNGQIPIPPGHRRSFLQRQRSIDIMTYDRMRVVTTEIRRVVSENRWIELRLSPVNTLGYEKLLSVFRWL
ncbi:MAG: GIY-YIG nuclease family protein [candidate division WOR-3 bacterium]|nr:MAG: GIY-YIG nuclease family protein [candidate division WOR-3 bacterium]